jgi:hypothetical protein
VLRRSSPYILQQRRYGIPKDKSRLQGSDSQG